MARSDIIITAAPTMTRPADTTAYASGDLVANSTTAGSVVPLAFTLSNNGGGKIKVRRAYINKSTTSVANSSFRLHLYTASPTLTNGDNGALVSNQQATYLGSLDITVGFAFSAAAGGWGAATIGAEVMGLVSASATLYGLLEARAAYTPGNAETFAVTIEAELL
jgi:hypothetical protein